MTVDCPNCHAPVEFRFDGSFVRVCEHCQCSVLRTDRGVESLGQFADLMPIDSPLTLFAEAHDRGPSFLLIGMAQLQHAAGGRWQEWYCKLDGGGWGWLSEAQGRYYMTYEAADVVAPPAASLAPGAVVAIAHGGETREYTVGELGVATYAAARGEIPYRLVPGTRFQFADLSAADGAFVTIDYGDPSAPDVTPAVYVGRQLSVAELQISGGEPTPVAAPTSGAATKVACPNCSGPLELRAPEQTQRIACPYCGTLVGVGEGPLTIIAKQAQVPKPDLTLGAKVTFSEGEMQIVGYLRRCALIDGSEYGFDEYLLFAPAIGFRWLVSSDNHWSYVQPIAPGAVTPHKNGWTYDGVAFRTFQTSRLRVDAVLGEMYWRVAVGDFVEAEDAIAPPAMLSREQTGSEDSWSLGTYLTLDQVRAGVGQPELQLPPPLGVAPNQPPRAQAAARVMSFGLFVLVGLGIVFGVTAPAKQVFRDQVQIPSASAAAASPATPAPALSLDPNAPPPEPQPVAYFSPPFALRGGKNIEIEVAAGLNNDWAYAAIDLVEEKTGQVVSVDAEVESYSGVEDGESWSEGDPVKTEILGPMPAGDYLLRVESQHGAAGTAVMNVIVRQGVFRGLHLILALLALLVPYLIVGGVASSFESKRWENSTLGDSAKPSTGVGIAFFLVKMLFAGIWGLLQIVFSISTNDD